MKINFDQTNSPKVEFKNIPAGGVFLWYDTHAYLKFNNEMGGVAAVSLEHAFPCKAEDFAGRNCRVVNAEVNVSFSKL